MKRRIAFVFIVLALVIYFTFNKYAPVKPFLPTDELAEALEVEPSQIAEVYKLAEHYRYVAYTKEQPSMSLWKFENRKWRPINDIIGNEIIVMHIDDIGAYYIWHFAGEGMAKLNLYAMHERNYMLSYDDSGDAIGSYYPEIVLQHVEPIDAERSHGLFKVPDDWQAALKQPPQQDFFRMISYETPPQYMWEVVDASGEVVRTIRADETYSHGNDDNDSEIHHLMRFE